ncbi:MAG TPA: DoxX family membrane protein [Chryseolinea sp.]|nr:DoxX family membrane protein [Chryseolinea sp.]
MSTKVKSISATTARIVLGLIYFVFGLNFFFHFIPTPPPSGGVADAFTGGLFQSGYFFPMLKGLEVVLGALLLIGFFVPLALVVLMPISINILLFHAFLSPDNTIMGIVIVSLQIYLSWFYRDYYKPLFSPKTTITA